MKCEEQISDELVQLEHFVNGDKETAERAFDRLSDRIDRFLHRYLRSLVPNEPDREDIIATVKEKLVSKREGFQLKGVGAWWAYVATIARRCVYDRSPQTQNVELVDQLPDQEIDAIGRFAEISHLRSVLYRAADELWLGVPRKLPEAERRRRVLAAQLFYQHGSSWQEITEILSGAGVLSRSTLDGWLTDKSVLLDLAYSTLYVDNDALTGLLLRPDNPLNAKELDAILSPRGATLDGWTIDELRVVVWRYRNGLLDEKIQQLDRRLTEQFIEAVFVKCRPRFPFERRVKDLQKSLEKRRVSIDLLANAGLWKRLVFQYSIVHELPHRQILERIEKPAETAGYSVTAGMLAAWLSNGRLLEQLTTHIKEAR